LFNLIICGNHNKLCISSLGNYLHFPSTYYNLHPNNVLGTDRMQFQSMLLFQGDNQDSHPYT
jgi:hypothetical protein